MTLFLRYAAKSDVGMVRSANEDSGFAGHSLLAVADGMGGHAAGELASSTAIATLAELESEELTAENLLTSLDEAIITAAMRIAQFIEADPSRSGMGTTMTAILWKDDRIAVIHVGDSRAYLLRDGELSQITRDHTYVQSLIDAGRITPEQARRHPKRNLLLRAIDGSQVPDRDPSIRQAQVGDRYLLCSDGLCGVIDDVRIGEVLRDVVEPTAAVTELVDLALEAGAPDNVTAVVADVVEADDEEVQRVARWGSPVVVGAAGEARNRAALPGLHFPDDVGPSGSDGDEVGPAVPGGLAARGTEREGGDPATSIGVVKTSELPVPKPAGGPPAEDGEPARAAEQPGFLSRHAGLVVGLVVVVAGLLLGLVGFLWWLSSQWYVGADGPAVAIYRGVPQQIAGVQLSRVQASTDLAVEALPSYDRQQLERTIDAATRQEADRIVADLTKKAEACAQDPAPAGCPEPAPEAEASPGTSPGPSSTPRTSDSASPSPGGARP
jgi:protein phosphatase